MVHRAGLRYFLDEVPGFTAEKKAFGFKRFVPELLKHKTIWRDVLLASLAIQLVGRVHA